ncbi:MAG: hypothetical protein H0X26_02415 [Alphaproteobacteria bacterium]|nr:hypothetical protein [Alphaproteobacteria bacterium]
MIKKFKLMSSSFLMAVTLAAPFSSHAMDTGTEFNEMNSDARKLIVKQAAVEKCLEEKNPVTLNITLRDLALVSREWKDTVVDIIKTNMQVGQPIWKAWHGITPKNETVFQQFLNGTLVFRPNLASDEGKISLKISDITTLFKGPLDLSKCGDVAQKLVITTDPSVFLDKDKYEDKFLILVTMRSLIEKKINSTASPFEPIMKDWNEDIAPVGIFGRWGMWTILSWQDHHTTANLDDISSKNLYDNWQATGSDAWLLFDGLASVLPRVGLVRADAKNFMFIFKPK